VSMEPSNSPHHVVLQQQDRKDASSASATVPWINRLRSNAVGMVLPSTPTSVSQIQNLVQFYTVLAFPQVVVDLEDERSRRAAEGQRRLHVNECDTGRFRCVCVCVL
jgi:hypothetical protein